jgi:hypothetical protein
MTEDIKLDGHHRKTVEKIFNHPVSHNIQWHDVLSLLEQVGTVEERHDGRYAVRIGSPEIKEVVFDVHKSHDLTEQQVVDVRKMLTDGGVTAEPVRDG